MRVHCSALHRIVLHCILLCTFIWWPFRDCPPMSSPVRSVLALALACFAEHCLVVTPRACPLVVLACLVIACRVRVCVLPCITSHLHVVPSHALSGPFLPRPRAHVAGKNRYRQAKGQSGEICPCAPRFRPRLRKTLATTRLLSQSARKCPCMPKPRVNNNRPCS